MNAGKRRHAISALRRFVTLRLLFELVLVATIIASGIWIAKRPPRVESKPPVLMDIPRTGDHIVVVKKHGSAPQDSRFWEMILRGGTVVDLRGRDMLLTNPRLDKPIMFNLGSAEILYVGLSIEDPHTTTASELGYAIRCISAAVPEGKKCYIEVYLP